MACLRGEGDKRRTVERQKDLTSEVLLGSFSSKYSPHCVLCLDKSKQFLLHQNPTSQMLSERGIYFSIL
jgi:hypothetical protein